MGDKGGKLRLEEPILGDLLDFCTAHFNAPQRDVICAALRHFIDHHLASEPEMRKRFEEAREARLGDAKKVTLIKGGKSDT